MTDLYNPGSNYESIMSIWKRHSLASDADLLDCIRSQCDPDKIRHAAIENGGNQVGVLGLIIEEVGRRRLRGAASIIVEYVAWPYYDDFWVHLVPKCFAALSEIGDESIVGRLLEVTSGDVFATEAIAALKAVSSQPYSVELTEPLKSKPEQDPRARIVMLAIAEELTSVAKVKAWADLTIGSATQPPPAWLCDLSMQGDFDTQRAPEDADIVFSFDERAICIVAFHKMGRIPLTETIERVFRDYLDGYSVGGKALVAVLQAEAFRANKPIAKIRGELQGCFGSILAGRPLLAKLVSDLTA